MLLFRCEYLQIISFIEARMPHFLDKYPGYKMVLFKLHYFGMIIQEKPHDDIYNFILNFYFLYLENIIMELMRITTISNPL